MAKLRHKTSRPASARTAKVSGPARRVQAKPAARKTVKSAVRKTKAPARPVKVAAKSARAARPAADPKKPGTRPPAGAAAKGAAKAAPPPPRRSTYADAVAMYERGMHALQAKRYRDAAEILKAVIAQFPEEKELHERAQLYIRVCERQLTPPDATPRTSDERIYAATLAINAGAVDKAIALLNGAIQLDRDNDSAEYMLGVALAMRGDVQGAIAHITRAVELNPESRELVRKEPDLEPLRQTDEIRALLAAPAAPPPPPRKEKRPAARVRPAR